MTASQKKEKVMRLRISLTCLWCIAILALAAPLFAATLDDGKLEVSWFSDDAVFREADEIDYLWVSEGFDLDGKSLQFRSTIAANFSKGLSRCHFRDSFQLSKNRRAHPSREYPHS